MIPGRHEGAVARPVASLWNMTYPVRVDDIDDDIKAGAEGNAALRQAMVAGSAAALLANSKNRHLRRLGVTIITTQAGYALGRKAHGAYTSRRLYSVTVEGNDEMYGAVLESLLKILPSESRKALTVFSRLIRQDFDFDEPGMAVEVGGNKKVRLSPKLSLRYDGDIAQKAVIGGYRINVSLTKAQVSPKEGGYSPDRLTFNCPGIEARDAVLGWLDQVNVERFSDPKRIPQFWVASKWGSWDLRSDLPVRSLDTVILTDGLAEKIRSDLTEFFDQEPYYNTLGIPYHRGYLLHGPAGTGKTSVARALATDFGLDVYYIPLGDMDKDSNLMSLVSSISARSMLLLEDIDTAHVATDRTDDANQASLSGLLNALDGVSTPHGLVTVMTTNYPDKLDAALVRPGRVDQRFEIDVLDAMQFKSLFQMFYGPRPVPDAHLFSGVAPAAVIEVFKHHIGDPDGALTALKNECATTT